MQLKTEAIVIHSLRYAEADLIVKLFSKKEGVNSYLIKGVLKSKKGKIRASFFQPLSLLDIDAIHNNKNSLFRLKEVKSSIHYKSLHTNIIKGGIVTFVTEVLNQVLTDCQVEEDIYDFVKKAAIWLDQNENNSLFPQFFLIQLCEFLGFYPDTTNDDLPFFDLQEGKFEVFSKSMYCIQEKELVNFKKILGIDFDSLSVFTMPKLERLKLLENILVYFFLHIEGFRRPKSINVIQELFS